MSKADQAPKPEIEKRVNREAHQARLKQSKLLHATLKVVYPGLFDLKNPVPLAIGIDKQMCKAFPNTSRKSVRRLPGEHSPFANQMSVFRDEESDDYTFVEEWFGEDGYDRGPLFWLNSHVLSLGFLIATSSASNS